MDMLRRMVEAAAAKAEREEGQAEAPAAGELAVEEGAVGGF